MKPKDVTKDNELEVLRRFPQDNRQFKKPKFKINDYVRVSKLKHVFDKGTHPIGLLKFLKL